MWDWLVLSGLFLAAGVGVMCWLFGGREEGDVGSPVAARAVGNGTRRRPSKPRPRLCRDDR